MKQKPIKQELKDLDSPILAKWQGEAKEWSTPDNYLKGLTHEVIEQSRTKTRILTFKSTWKIAAAILFILAGTWIFLNIQPKNTSMPLANLDNISIDEIQDYVLNNIDDFDMELLEEHAKEAGFNTPLQLDNFTSDEDWFEENTEVDFF